MVETPMPCWTAWESSRDDAIRELFELAQDGMETNWDGHGGLPVSAVSLKAAVDTLHEIFPGTPIPEVAAEPDGSVGLEWSAGGKWLVVSFSPSGALDFAAGIDGRRRFGHEPYRGQLSQDIVGLISETTRS